MSYNGSLQERIIRSGSSSYRGEFGNKTGGVSVADTITCPICGYTYSHVVDVVRKEGGIEWAAWSGRGDCIYIRFEGECGHAWEIGVGYHKGENFIFWSEILGNLKPVLPDHRDTAKPERYPKIRVE